MTRRNRLALVISLVSLLVCMHVAPVSECELNGVETCERAAVPASQTDSGVIAIDAVATPETTNDGINADAPMPDAIFCGIVSSPCETVGV
ncbi:MAG: hypothetical protein ACR2JW_14815 [Thermomicrobiales bacterium]